MDCSLPDFFFHGIFQARVLEWVAISFSRVTVDFEMRSTWTKVGPLFVISYSVVWTLCYPMDYSLPGSSVRRLFQATVLEWVAIFYSKVIGSEGLKMLRGLSWKAHL